MATAGLQQGSCHLQGFSALAVEGSPGWTSGPPKCWEDLENPGVLIDKGHNTYVSAALACLEWGASYSPALLGGLSTLMVQDYPMDEQATLECQRRCAKDKRCSHFTMTFPSRTCTLASNLSVVTNGLAGALSGPPKCGRQNMQSYYWQLLPSFTRRFWVRPRLSVHLASVAVSIVGASGLVAWRRQRAQAARSMFQAGHGNADEEVSDPFMHELERERS
eukprot:TRINITY_DN92494_c0_g1_i1.p1 TRINITY_DN92494_c0_g1~~TRINITY_DN92494_c0_g1_i1.p1  ORF type:complete len:244 (-),score=25.01 TRINITY_DN92494_c0_g1_i1:127-786(-)